MAASGRQLAAKATVHTGPGKRGEIRVHEANTSKGFAKEPPPKKKPSFLFLVWLILLRARGVGSPPTLTGLPWQERQPRVQTQPRGDFGVQSMETCGNESENANENANKNENTRWVGRNGVQGIAGDTGGEGGYPGLPGILADLTTHEIREISLRRKVKFMKGAGKWRLNLGIQTFCGLRPPFPRYSIDWPLSSQGVQRKKG